MGVEPSLVHIRLMNRAGHSSFPVSASVSARRSLVEGSLVTPHLEGWSLILFFITVCRFLKQMNVKKKKDLFFILD